MTHKRVRAARTHPASEVRPTHRWSGESGANQSLKWDFLGRELRLDSKTFMDEVGRERTLFGAWIDQISLCVSRLLPLRCRFKSLKLLLFMPTAGLTAGQFPVYKKLRRPYHPRMQRKAHVAQQLSEPRRVDEFTAPSLRSCWPPIVSSTWFDIVWLCSLVVGPRRGDGPGSKGHRSG